MFVSHTTEGKEVSEDDFFKKASTGGTYISSGLQTSLDIIEKKYPISNWNIYAFHCSDGENWPQDNEKAVNAMQKVIDITQMSAYIQINRENENIWGEEMTKVFTPLECDSFKLIKITSKEDIWPQFTKLFGGKYNV